MAITAIRLGQVWREDATGDNFLVTKVHKEVFESYAVMREVADATDGVRKVKVAKAAKGVTLPGFTCEQDSSSF